MKLQEAKAHQKRLRACVDALNLALRDADRAGMIVAVSVLTVAMVRGSVEQLLVHSMVNPSKLDD